MLTRRQALGCISVPMISVAAGAALTARLSPRAHAIAQDLSKHNVTAADSARDEDYWSEVGRAFTVDRSVVNLNNGGVSPSPGWVQDAMKRHLDFSNSTPPPVALWQVLEPRKEGVRQRLGAAFGVDAEEIAITRNASEGLQTCQFGFDLKPGDEVLCTMQDYPRMISTFKQRERREGIVLKQFRIPTPCEEPRRIVELYEQNITAKTRLILVSHVVFLTGQILPVKEVVALGRRRGIPVIIDGAHSFAHLDFKLSDLDCDYFSSSLHKWLFAPHGTGLLYVRRDKIGSLWPLMAAEEAQKDNIRKFEEIGTHPAANALAVGEALSFNLGIGLARKSARMHYLKSYWISRLQSAGVPIVLRTSPRPEFSCGLATFDLEGTENAELCEWLWSHKRILTVAITHEDVRGIRVSPSVYTTLEDLDRFVDAIQEAIRTGIARA